jgi:hypothetical protein
MSYNLNENIKESFEFTLGDFTYKMVYPTTEEIEQLEKIKDEEKRGLEIFKFISSDNAEAPAIDTALKKYNIKVMQNFIKMIQAEMGV